MNTAPTIMVSSTFYDLRQVRTDLYSFIADNLGYIALLSELPSFPVDPDVDTIENCRRRVQENADIMVLVIGGRYGSIDSKTDKSITNLEFLAARAKGIPIYTFVDKSVLSIMPVWKASPDADFSKVVDTPRIFEFIDFVRSSERVWTFEFETAQNIINILRTQLAYLMQDSLKVRKLLSGTGMPRFMEELSSKTLRFALEKGEYWEYFLFLHATLDEIERRTNMIREYRLGLLLNSSTYVAADSAPDWLQTRMYELSNFVESANQLIGKALQEALGKPGEPGDAEQIVWVAQMLGRLLEQALQWAAVIRCTRFEPPFEEMASEMPLTADDLISQLEKYPKEALRKFEEALERAKSSTERQTVELILTITLSNQDRLQEVIEKAKRYYGTD